MSSSFCHFLKCFSSPPQGELETFACLKNGADWVFPSFMSVMASVSVDRTLARQGMAFLQGPNLFKTVKYYGVQGAAFGAVFGTCVNLIDLYRKYETGRLSTFSDWFEALTEFGTNTAITSLAVAIGSASAPWAYSRKKELLGLLFPAVAAFFTTGAFRELKEKAWERMESPLNQLIPNA